MGKANRAECADQQNKMKDSFISNTQVSSLSASIHISGLKSLIYHNLNLDIQPLDKAYFIPAPTVALTGIPVASKPVRQNTFTP